MERKDKQRQDQTRAPTQPPGRKPGSEEDRRCRQRAPGGDMASIDERDDVRAPSEDEVPRRRKADHGTRPRFGDRERGDEESGRPLKLDR